MREAGGARRVLPPQAKGFERGRSRQGQKEGGGPGRGQGVPTSPEVTEGGGAVLPERGERGAQLTPAFQGACLLEAAWRTRQRGGPAPSRWASGRPLWMVPDCIWWRRGLLVEAAVRNHQAVLEGGVAGGGGAGPAGGRPSLGGLQTPKSKPCRQGPDLPGLGQPRHTPQSHHLILRTARCALSHFCPETAAPRAWECLTRSQPTADPEPPCHPAEPLPCPCR